LDELGGESGSLGVEASAYRGVCLSMIGKHEEARVILEACLAAAVGLQSSRLEALALASLGLALQRADRSGEALDAYRRALAAAGRANDGPARSPSVQLNLAACSRSAATSPARSSTSRLRSTWVVARVGNKRRQALLNWPTPICISAGWRAPARASKRCASKLRSCRR